MRSVADLDLCQGHGMCEDTVAEVFRVVESDDGSYGHVKVLIPEPDAGLRERVEAAVRFYPNRALSIQQRGRARQACWRAGSPRPRGRKRS